jgi:hypothetical protein
VIAYAVIDETVTYTGDTCVSAGGRTLPPAKGLAMCQNLGDDKYLLFHCTADWYVLGAGFFSSIEDAKRFAEAGYRGVGAKWVEVNTTEAQARAYLERDRGDMICSFCLRSPKEPNELTVGPTVAICQDCFDKTYAIFEREGLA